MSGYGIRTRLTSLPSAQKDTREDTMVWRDTSFSYISRSEQTMSYRTGSAVGTPVMDHIADPYAWFLRRSAEKKHVSAKAHYGKQPVAAASKGFKPHSDNGHPFWTTNRWIATSAMRNDYQFENQSGSMWGKYLTKSGPLWACRATIAPAASSRMLFNMQPNSAREFGLVSEHPEFKNPGYYAQKAINNLAPNRPDFNLSAFLGELREGLPTFIGVVALQKRTENLKDLGKNLSGEVLNHQFGIVPLVNDIQRIFSTLSRVSQILLQNEKDAGNGVRRRMAFKVREDLASFPSSDLQSQGDVVDNPFRIAPVKNFTPNTWSVWGADLKSSVTQTVVERISFSGSFTTYLPVGTTFSERTERYMKLGQRLFGVGLTPATLWQLTPWSWLADWLYDIENTLSAQERMADDSLVMNYGFLMRESIYRSTQETTLTALYPRTKMPVSAVSSTAVSHKKERLRANPYGFAASTPTGFDPRQWTILAALGISRM